MKQDNSLFEAVSSFLSSPSAFDDGTVEVKTISTHASIVFLGRSLVYKIKRPVQYDYMDFSTPEKRKANCDNEFALNKAIAPSLYLSVCAITLEENGDLKIDGEGEPIEWAVKMRRFPEEQVLKNLALKNNFQKAHAIELGQSIASYHNSLPPLKVHDGASRIDEVIKELNRSFTPLEDLYEGFQTSSLLDALQDAFADCQAELDQRGEMGSVRRCHGDLHLNNIVMTANGSVPFDALEFDERLATIDVIYDLSFLLMDLLHMGLKRQANTVLHRYALNAWELMSHGGFKILPLCLSIRSAIRAMVLSQQASLSEPADKTILKEAKSYLSLAKELLERSPPALLAVGGLSGTGKSTLAVELAALKSAPLGAVLLRSDLERKEMLGVSEFEHLSEENYSSEMSSRVYDQMLKKAEQILTQGQSVILDAVFLSKTERDRANGLANKRDVSFCGLYLDAPLPTLLSRVGARSNDASDADQAVVKKQYELKPNFSDCENKSDDMNASWISIDASGTKTQTFDNAKAILLRRDIL